ncbi:MAG: hypothetical protein ABI831_08865 [Betaproteobacteria bacterium]
MANDQTKISASNQDGHQFDFQVTRTDSPILPAANLEHLQRVDPTLVGFVVDQTKVEGDHRRSRQTKTDRFILFERLGSLFAATTVALAALGLAVFLAMHDHEAVACVIGGTPAAIITAYLIGGRTKNKPAQQEAAKPKAKARRRG